MSERDLPIDFNSFIVSLASSAMLHLGETPHPETGAVQAHLPLARNTIDLLAMLKDKTRGNLDEEETRLLQAVLDELSAKLKSKS